MPTPVEEFAAYLEQGEIRLQRCSSCGTRRIPPRSVCAVCLSREATWEPAARRGRVVSFTVARESIGTDLEAPYTIAQAELDDGVRWTANLIGAHTELPRIGLPVRLVIGERDGRSLAQFEVDDDARDGT